MKLFMQTGTDLAAKVPAKSTPGNSREWTLSCLGASALVSNKCHLLPCSWTLHCRCSTTAPGLQNLHGPWGNTLKCAPETTHLRLSNKHNQLAFQGTALGAWFWGTGGDMSDHELCTHLQVLMTTSVMGLRCDTGGSYQGLHRVSIPGRSLFTEDF